MNLSFELGMAKGDIKTDRISNFDNRVSQICMAKIDKSFFPADFADSADFSTDKNCWSARSAGIFTRSK